MGNLGDWIGVFLIIAVLFGGNGGLFGGGTSVQDAINNQTTQSGIKDVLLSSLILGYNRVLNTKFLSKLLLG